MKAAEPCFVAELLIAGAGAGAARVRSRGTADVRPSAAAPGTQPAAATPRAQRQSLSIALRRRRNRVRGAEAVSWQGAKDIDHNDVRAAMDYFVRAAELNPEEKKYAMADQIAREHLVTDLIQQSDKDKILGHFADARAKIAEAYSVDPASPVVAQHMDELASSAVAGEPAARRRRSLGSAD